MGGTVSLTDKLFNAIDVDNDNYLTKEELADWFGHRIPNLSENDKQRMLARMSDKKTLNREDFKEFFKNWTGDQLESASNTIVRLHNMEREVLDILDEAIREKDYTDELKKDEVAQLLDPRENVNNRFKQIRGLFKLVDKTGSGKITSEALAMEFLRHFKIAGKRGGYCPCILCQFLFDQMELRAKSKKYCCFGNHLKYLDIPVREIRNYKAAAV
mmetsp:Transcript_12760/g.19115  ORF Transcript_12760/g.19115 Transcript_12760/m.19115 type:complete len:215 (+) Transcript_12760:35-679(+)|eukprot:CAMPEP_0167750222 /NCGR_PEP_ID=MMETSP0110_2-20121227/5866_1 /TAXON_ID=629695 /ORGANISM="Gymnochlora sp., Strain CCMP2014" /LENGTH=214 /DNA_ID=CAMNT_0007635509 /DNA_START=23 /DNA_END=667 /DNA_ORIENTATION=+